MKNLKRFNSKKQLQSVKYTFFKSYFFPLLFCCLLHRTLSKSTVFVYFVSTIFLYAFTMFMPWEIDRDANRHFPYFQDLRSQLSLCTEDLIAHLRLHNCWNWIPTTVATHCRIILQISK